MNIPSNYRFSEADHRHAMSIMLRYEHATDEELGLMEAACCAEEIQQQTGVWPTYGEVEAYFWKKADAYWQKHFGRNAPR